MTKKDLFEIALKIFGIYLLIHALDSLVIMANNLDYFFDPTSYKASQELVYITVSAFRIVVCAIGFWLLLFKTNYISNKLIKTNANAPVVLQLTKTDMLQVLFAASGIIIMFFALTELWSSLTMAAIWNYKDVSPQQRSLLYFLQMAIPISKVLLALSLLIASGGLANFFTRSKQPNA